MLYRPKRKAEFPLSGVLPCPYEGHHGRVFQSVDQLYDRHHYQDQVQKFLHEGLYTSTSAGNNGPVHAKSHLTCKSVYQIPGILSGAHAMNALGDTGAKYSFMKESYALQLGSNIQRDKTCKVAVSQDRYVTTTGVAHTTFRFEGERTAYHMAFHLLPSCIHEVILGNTFLKATSTFLDIKNRLRRVK